MVKVTVRDNDVNQALRALRRKMQREGIFREMRQHRRFEKPSQRRVRKQMEAVRRRRRRERRRLRHEGY